MHMQRVCVPGSAGVKAVPGAGHWPHPGHARSHPGWFLSSCAHLPLARGHTLQLQGQILWHKYHICPASAKGEKPECLVSFHCQVPKWHIAKWDKSLHSQVWAQQPTWQTPICPTLLLPKEGNLLIIWTPKTQLKNTWYVLQEPFSSSLLTVCNSR